jgi:hypothetical protein
MASDDGRPGDAVHEPTASPTEPVGAPAMDDRASDLPDGWWQHVLPAYMPAGAWRPHTDGESTLTAPVSPGSWMPPESSFHALRPGSSLATESGEPVVPTLAALASATSIPGLAHGTSIDGSALDDAVPTLAAMTATTAGGPSPLDRVQAAVEPTVSLEETVPGDAAGAVRAYDPAAFERAQSLVARYATEGGATTAVADAARAVGIPADATPRQAAQSVKRLATGAQRPVLPTSVVEGQRAQVSRVVTGAAVLAGIVVLTVFVFLAPDDESAGVIGLGLIAIGLVQAGFLVWAIVLAVRGRLLRITPDGARPLYAILLLTLCSPLPVLFVRFLLDALA